LVLINLFLIAFTGLLYLLILKFFDGEKLKDIINYVQIGLTIIITVGFQFIARVFEFIDIGKIEFTNTWWSYLIPPIWFAAPFEYILKGNREIYIIIYSVMAFIIPLVSIALYTFLMPAFESNLQKLNEVGGMRKNKQRFTDRVAQLICRRKEERSFYRFSTNMLKNEREFKLKVYPNLGFGLVFPFLMLLSFSIGSDFSEVRNSSAYFNIYFISLVISTMVNFLDYSGNYKGAWIYKVMPIDNPEFIYKGAVKAVFMNLFTPLFLIVSIVYLLVFGFRIFPHIVATYINMLLATAIIFKISNQSLPFSKAFETGVRGGIKLMFLSILTIGILFGGHFAFTFIPFFGVCIYIVIVIIAFTIVCMYLFRRHEVLE